MDFVNDLAIILISAGICTILCRALKQPLIIGYIIAGFIISPNLGIFGISSHEAVDQWSEIGIIFLMFGLGLEFSFKKLLKAGKMALVTAGSKFIGVFVIGFLVGQALGWSLMESIFLAGLLSMSSTVVIIKTYDDLGLKNKSFANIVFSALVVEDLIAILLMVLLTALAVSNKFSGGEMLMNLAKLIFFLVFWFIVGIYLIPTILKKTKKFLNDEILLIVSIGLCFLMVTLATTAGFSAELGAFMMGSILAETIEGEHIEKILHPIKDLFGAVFFVSVGMMISPTQIFQHWWIILLLAVIVIITLSFFAASGVLLAGGNLYNAVHTGVSLGQLGEFGFILAGMGVSLGVVRDFIYPVIIAVSVITIFVSPYIIKLGDPIYDFLKKKLPEKFLERFDRAESKENLSVAETSEWKKLLTAVFVRILVYGVLLIAILIVSDTYLDKVLQNIFPSLGKGMLSAISILITLLVMSPFLYGLGISSSGASSSIHKLLREKRSNSIAIFGLTLLRVFIAIGFILTVIARHVDLAGWLIVAILLGGVVFFMIARYYFNRFNVLEERFLSNLNEKEEHERKLKPVTSVVQGSLGNYDVKLESIAMSPNSIYVGKKLKEIPIREESGANIIKITRGNQNFTIPTGDQVLYPYDKILAVGTAEQIESLRSMMKAATVLEKSPEKDFNVEAITLNDESYMTGKTLRGLRLRDYNCMIISLLHEDKFITNPKPDTLFSTGDTVWLAGDINSLEWLK